MKTLKNKRVKVILCALCVMLALCMLMTGCTKNAPIVEPNKNDAAGNVGDINLNQNGNNAEDVGGVGEDNQANEETDEDVCPSSPFFYCAYKIDKTTYDIDNVTLTFYWGDYYPDGAEEELKWGRSNPEYDMYFKNAYGEPILIKHVEEELVSEKYNCEPTYESKRLTKIKFKHFEEITIPAEAFIGESGQVRFEVWTIDYELQIPVIFALTTIVYKVIGDKVILTEPEYEFEIEYEK